MCVEAPASSLEGSSTKEEDSVFAAIIALPVLAGLVAGTFSASRRLAHILAALCIVLGIAGAIVTGLDADTTDRASSVAFALVGGLVAALLLYGGWLVGRAGMRAMRNA
jgi:hypothetical protein